MSELVFLKLGGSLITNKTRRYSARREKLVALAGEIGSALTELPGLQLVLGHGSGSFGHFAVKEHLPSHSGRAPGAGDAAAEAAYWRGFAEVWYRASALNRLVMEALHEARVPAIALAPSAMVSATDGSITAWDLTPLEAALKSGLVPVIHGDIVFDVVRGGAVLSTEALMLHISHYLRPGRILLAGIEGAVWADFPSRRQPIESITAASYRFVADKIGHSHGTDVTGGMETKVVEMLGLVADLPELTVQIFSGEEPGNVKKALAGARLGTQIARD